jgi:hypothetical protein
MRQVTRDPAIKMAVNSVAKTLRRMTRRKALKLWEVGNCLVKPKPLWPIAERDGPMVPTVVHGPLGITYHQNEGANVIADCIENHITSHDLCDENYERRVKVRVQALLTSVDDTLLEK